MNRILAFITVLLVGISGSSCTLLKGHKLVLQGSVNNTDFHETVPYYTLKNWVIMDVLIKGKVYKFIFDTGADVTVISKKVAEEIDVSTEFNKNVGDSGNRKEGLDFVVMPDMHLGSLTFQNIGAAITDFQGLNALIGCDTIDGIIGNNLMRKAAWQVNFENEQVAIASSVNKFDLPSTAKKVELVTGKRGHAYFKIKVNGRKEYIAMDTGFNGKYQLSKKSLDKIAKKTGKIQIEEASGAAGGGLYGGRQGLSWVYQVETLEFGEVTLEKPLIFCSETSNGLLGNEFYNDYTLTIDWANKSSYFEPTTKPIRDTLRSYGVSFVRDFSETKIQIGIIWSSFKDQIGGLQVGQSVVSIHDENVQNMSLHAFCERFSEGVTKDLPDTIVVVVDDNGQRKEVTLNRKILFPR